MMNIGLTESDGKCRACSHDCPVGGSVESLSPHIGTLDFRTKEMHHSGDEFAGLEVIAAISPNGLLGFCLFFSFLFWFCGFDCHDLDLSGLTQIIYLVPPRGFHFAEALMDS